MFFSTIKIFKKIITEYPLKRIISGIKVRVFIKLFPLVKIYRRLFGKQLTYTVSRYDRFGSQYLSMIGGIAWCELMNYKYIHTTFQSTSKDSDKYRDGYRDKNKWNKFVGFPIERNVQDFTIVRNVQNFTGIIRITKKEIENIDIIENEQKIYFFLRKPDKLFTKKMLKKVKHYYYSVPKPIIKEQDIVIHIRRGDVSAFNVYKNRFTSNKNYVSLIKYFKKKYPKYTICIYSQGEIEDFGELQMLGVNFDLNSETTKVFHSFVQAKILVTAKSAFSYTAALLSDHTIYYMPFKFFPLKHWRVIPNNFFEE
jgi:hypothetical protein